MTELHPAAERLLERDFPEPFPWRDHKEAARRMLKDHAWFDYIAATIPTIYSRHS